MVSRMTVASQADLHGPKLSKSSDDGRLLLLNETSFNSRRKYITVALLMLINALNYADRFTIAG